jgi:hypothetical protein
MNLLSHGRAQSEEDGVNDDRDAMRLRNALVEIIRACQGGTPIGDKNWNEGIKAIAVSALEDIRFDWKAELNRPPRT